MKVWTSLTGAQDQFRWKTLSEALTAAGAKNEFREFNGRLEKAEDLALLAEFDHCRFSGRVAALLQKSLKVQSSWTVFLGVADGMNKTPQGWWPLCALYESFGQLLIQVGHNIDRRGSVVVAGAGGAARTAMAAFFKAGFQKFLVTNFDQVEAEELMREVRSRFFGMEVQWVPMDKIVLLPGESSVLVNCTPNVKDNKLLTELSYLNFLRRPGLLIDMNLDGLANVLLEEARDAGVTSVSGIDLACRSDLLWAKWSFGAVLDPQDYGDRFRKALG